MVNDRFLTKKGVVINNLASDLLKLEKGDKMPNISDMQKYYSASRGTIQNAITYLKNENAIVTKNRGHLGTYIESIDYKILQLYALSDSILGTMTLPYSKLYEGLATGIYDEFNRNKINLNLAYIRGSEERIKSIILKTYRFAVVSEFAAKYAINQGAPINISVDFGENTYLSNHVLLFSDFNKEKIEDGMRVGIDHCSIDQKTLTLENVRNKDVELIDVPGYQLVNSLKNNKIDVGIWNFDEIKDKNYKHVKYAQLEVSFKEMKNSVIICHKEDTSIQAFFQKSFNIFNVLETQSLVKKGILIPQY